MFSEIITVAAARYDVSEAVIEKDYYVTMLLKNMARRLPFLVFKGGTSLSKCYQIIHRFSEDIDLTVDRVLTQGMRRSLKNEIRDTVDEVGLSVENWDTIQSRRQYNRYEIVYSSHTALSAGLTDRIIIETSLMSLGMPAQMKPIEAMLTEVLKKEHQSIIKEFSLHPFSMKVQNIERTFIDKIFAICDYYLCEQTMRHSRHLYDIAKIWALITPNDSFRALIAEVRETRQSMKNCPSAQPDVIITEVLREIINRNVYQADYEKLTRNLLAEPFSYADTLEKLREVADSDLF